MASFKSSSSRVTFKEFAIELQGGSIVKAGNILSEIFGVNELLGLKSANFFALKLKEQPDLFQQVMEIRDLLHAGKQNDALLIIMKCFDLNAIDAIQALAGIKKQL